MAHSIGLKIAAIALAALPFNAQAQATGNRPLTLDERSTVDTIPLQTMGQEALADTVIEGGLAPSPSGRPQPPNPLGENFSPFTDPLTLTLDGNRTGANRFPLNFDIQYQDPANIPGIEFGRSYNIAPQLPNRTYDFYQSTTTER